MSLTLCITRSSRGVIPPGSPATLVPVTPWKACGKTSNRLSAACFCPLPIPSHPGSHIALDFVTGLPPSEGNTIILTTVDRFSKILNFLDLSKLPTAQEITDIMVHHVFQFHQIPADIISNRGPQFVSQVCKAFCNAVSATGKRNRPNRTWKHCCSVLLPVIPHPGAFNSP